MKSENLSELTRLRIDKWLWAARFFKTRSLAIQAVDGGKVKLNGERAKPSKEVKVGDQLQIQIAEQLWAVEVLGLSGRRGPAPEARLLYTESAESQQRRLEQSAERRLLFSPGEAIKGRPTKKDRRMIHRFTEGG